MKNQTVILLLVFEQTIIETEREHFVGQFMKEYHHSRTKRAG